MSIQTKNGKISYIGTVNPSSKLIKGVKYNVDTFGVYLSPSNSSGYQVCPKATKGCIKSCLAGSGHAKISSTIPKARIIKTKFLFEEPERYANILVKEIENAKKLSEKKGHKFVCRLNCTSDLNLEDIGGINFLSKFSTVQFYEYTKREELLPLAKKYPNLNYTYSYAGDIGNNWDRLKKILDNGQNCAIVFYPNIPKIFRGYECIDGDISDLRYKDETSNVGKIVALKYKHVKGETKEDILNNSFIIKTQLNKLTNEYEVI